MKKIIIYVLLIITISISISFLLYTKKQAYETKEEYLQQKSFEANTFLSEKYGQDLKYDILNYDNKDGFRVNYSLRNYPNIKFSVNYWTNKQQFSDNFLQQCLSVELEELISETLSKNNVNVSNIHIGSMIGPPFDLTKRLYNYYLKLKRIPKLEDIKGYEYFMYIHVVVDSEEKSIIAYDILSDMDLPTEKIEVTW